jgi:hypothetical protein
MKRTSEKADRAQDQAAIRRHLLETGEIRLIRPVPNTQDSSRQADDRQVQREIVPTREEVRQ